jgi:hypothetical protein
LGVSRLFVFRIARPWLFTSMGIDMDGRLLSAPTGFRQLRGKGEAVGVGGIVISVSDVFSKFDPSDD